MDGIKQEKNNQIEQAMKQSADENEPKRQAEHRAKKD